MPRGGATAGGKFTSAWDSTQGVGPGFYWLGAGVLLFIIVGTVKAYYDDKKWDAKVMKMMSRKGRDAQEPNRIVARDPDLKKN